MSKNGRLDSEAPVMVSDSLSSFYSVNTFETITLVSKLNGNASIQRTEFLRRHCWIFPLLSLLMNKDKCGGYQTLAMKGVYVKKS